MIGVARCQELADHYKKLSQAKGISPERAFLLKNIAGSLQVQLVNWIDSLRSCEKKKAALG
jgi:hypothetical protein